MLNAIVMNRKEQVIQPIVKMYDEHTFISTYLFTEWFYDLNRIAKNIRMDSFKKFVSSIRRQCYMCKDS